MARQAIVPGYPLTVYVNETSTKDIIAATVYINESQTATTIASSTPRPPRARFPQVIHYEYGQY